MDFFFKLFTNWIACNLVCQQCLNRSWTLNRVGLKLQWSCLIKIASCVRTCDGINCSTFGDGRIYLVFAASVKRQKLITIRENKNIIFYQILEIKTPFNAVKEIKSGKLYGAYYNCVVLVIGRSIISVGIINKGIIVLVVFDTCKMRSNVNNCN